MLPSQVPFRQESGLLTHASLPGLVPFSGGETDPTGLCTTGKAFLGNATSQAQLILPALQSFKGQRKKAELERNGLDDPRTPSEGREASPLAGARLPAKPGRGATAAAGVPTRAHAVGRGPCEPAAGARPERGRARDAQSGGRGNPGPPGSREAPAPGWEPPARAAALTCQTLAPRPQARAPPGRLPSRGTRARPPLELRAPRVTGGGTEAGRAATGPEREEAYIGGAGRATPRSPFLSGSRLRSPGTASRQPRPAAPRPSPEAPPRRQPGFRQPHSAHSGQGRRHLVGGGKAGSAHARWERWAGRRPAGRDGGSGLRRRSGRCPASAVFG